MIVPSVLAGIEQEHNVAANGIDAGQICAFAEIASVTREGQSVRIVGSVLEMLYGYDVVHVERGVNSRLRKLAILASIFCPVATGGR